MFAEKKIIGLDIGHNVIKVVALKKGKKPQIETSGFIDLYQSRKLNKPEDMNDTIIVQAIRELLKEVKGGVKKVRTTFSSVDSFIRQMELPVLQEDELKSAIRFNIESLIPISSENVEFDFQIVETDKTANKQSVLVGLVPSSEMKRHLEILTRNHLEPDKVDISAIAVYNCFVALEPPPEKTTAILNIGADQTTIVVIHPAHFPYFGSVPIGGNTLTRTIEKKCHTSFFDSEKQKVTNTFHYLKTENTPDEPQGIDWKAAILEMANHLTDEIKKADVYYQILHGEEPVSRILLTGGGSLLKNLDFLLAMTLKAPVELWNPFNSDRIESLPKNIEGNDGLFFTTALGLVVGD
ncbi:MAG: type IV pilus assembly protein PilM [Candidatus Marinimicrobia bacterium]|nr:type IV pilus assembly protein PilM [Candidatus Neomarinimicrobiota bacterium]